MDFVLEIFDSVMFDRMYANLLPRASAFSAFDPISTITAGKGFDNSTSFDSATAGVDVLRSTWQFEPASKYMSVQPSEYAYMSRWDRDNVWRQTISLYILTWYVAESLQHERYENTTLTPLQALRRSHLRHIRIPQLHLRLRQGHLPTSQIPQEPDAS